MREHPNWLEPAHAAGVGVVDRPPIDGFLAAFLDDYSPTAIVDPPEPRGDARHVWRVFFVSTEARDEARAAIAASEWDARIETAPVDVEDEGWAERSQAELMAIEVGRLIVAPPWDLPKDLPGKLPEAPSKESNDQSGEIDSARGADALAPIVIVIEPSMGFGTGHHQSTRLCLRALQAIPLDGLCVLDLGTGSGVLAIAAATLGAASVLAWDDDQDAVEAAKKNVALNGVEAIVRVEQADLTKVTPAPADLVLANLTGALLARHAESIMRHTSPGTQLILSGFTEDERYTVRHAFRALTIMRDDGEDGWLGLTLQA